MALSSHRRVGQLREASVIPGFGLTFGFTILALSLVVLLPLAALMLNAFSIGPAAFLAIATDARVLAALRLSFGAAIVAALVNAVFGLLVAWVLVRYTFPGKRFLDAMVDLPFALPTAVAGIALAAIYAPNGPIGGFAQLFGIKVAYTPLGVILALIFIGLPFVVRTVQPVLEDSEREIEEAATLLGASRLRVIFQVILPNIYPALLTGVALAFARGVGEYGSVIFIAGNIPMVSEIAPLLIVIKLEEFDYAGATVIATVMMLISFALLFIINALQAWQRRRFSNV
jgi:sulfate/thiosulfate transport system permease protein